MTQYYGVISLDTNPFFVAQENKSEIKENNCLFYYYEYIYNFT